MAPATMDKRLKKALSKHQAGKYAEAKELYQRLLRDNPDHLDANYLLGTLYAEQQNLPKAMEHLARAERINPNSPWVKTNLGNIFRLRGDLDTAVAYYHQAIALDSQIAEPHCNLANILYKQNRIDEAEHHYRLAISFKPDFADAYFGLAEVHKYHGQTAEAETCYRRAIEFGGRQRAESAAYMLSALKGEVVASAPSGYVEELFDRFAPNFETHLVNELHYQIPRLLREAFPEDIKFTNVLDMGCGTGLAGTYFRDAAEHLTGIDLSTQMIAEAEKKKIYDQLLVTGIGEYLGKTNQKFDLFIAADVFVYIGALEGIFDKIGKAAMPGAWLTFSTEKSNGTGFELRSTGRYAHATSYIEQLANQYGFEITLCQRVNLRKERDGWIEGEYFILKARAQRE